MGTRMNIRTHFAYAIKDDQIIDFLNNLSWRVGLFGGRRLVLDVGFRGSLCINEMIKKLNVEHNRLCTAKLPAIIKKLEELDKKGDFLLAKSSLFKRAATSVRRFFGNYGYNRQANLDKLRSFEKMDQKNS